MNSRGRQPRRRTDQALKLQRGLVTLALLAGIAGFAAFAAAQPAARSHRGSSWRRVFFDDFRHGLRPSAWEAYVGEPAGDPGGWWAPSHAVVRRGILRLETYRDRRYGGRWVSGGVSSAPALKQTYGKYEVRLRLQPGRGVAFIALLWPATNEWPPEIDFAEDDVGSRRHLTATLHYGPRGHANPQIQRTVSADFTRWHVLGVEWTPGHLAYTLDGHVWAKVKSAGVPAQPMVLDLQAQTGTCGDTDAPCPDRTTPPRVNAEIDWVAAYAWRGPSR
jgi:beta-glucanase (GH16 family)